MVRHPIKQKIDGRGVIGVVVMTVVVMVAVVAIVVTDVMVIVVTTTYRATKIFLQTPHKFLELRLLTLSN